MRGRVLKFLKNVRERKSPPVSAVVASLVALSTFSLYQITEATLTSSAPVTVEASAGRWIASSLTLSPQDYRTVTATWSAVSGYTSYTLQWSKTSNFASFSSSVVAGTSFKVSNLEELTNYYFRVQAVGAPTSGWSSTATVKTPGAPSIITAMDIVAYDPSGQSWNYGVAGTNTTPRKSIGIVESAIPDDFYVTDWNGDGIQDLILKNTNDQLELRYGLAEGGFSTLIIGDFGWKDYDITIGKWKKTDTLPSIIAIQKSTGDLYLYENPNGAAHGARIKFDVGWTGLVINLIDYDKDGNTDVIAKFPTGDLKLYRSNGAGAFITEARPVISTNWNIVDSIHMSSGAEGAGSRGIVAREISSGDLYYYPIGTSSFGVTRKFNSGFAGYRIAGN
jgi:hypothetical protein